MPYKQPVAVLTSLAALLCCQAAAPVEKPATRPVTRPVTRPATPERRAPQAEADAEEHEAEYIEYRSSPELGHITIANGSVRGEARAKKGIFPCTDEKRPHVHRRREKMGGRSIDTTVIIQPPTGEGDDGEYGTQR